MFNRVYKVESYTDPSDIQYTIGRVKKRLFGKDEVWYEGAGNIQSTTLIQNAKSYKTLESALKAVGHFKITEVHFG